MSFQAEIDKAIKEKKLYFIGDALPVDWYAGFKLWLAHAEAGDAKAQYNVGRCYDIGDGTDKDREKAFYWYMKAAEQEDPRANFNLYIYYKDDKEKTYDLNISEAYLKKAVELKESRALNVMNKRAEYAHFQKGEKLKEEIQNLLLNKKLDEAKKIASEALEKNYPWASSLICALNIEILKAEVTTTLDKDVTEGGMINGTTQYYTTLTEYKTTKITIKNPTDHEVNIGFIEKESRNIIYFNSFITINKLMNTELLLNGDLELIKDSGCFIISFFDKPNEWDNRFKGDLIVNGTIQFIKIPILSAPRATRQKINKRGGCFVLTACYENEEHATVKDFRRFRDTVLTKYYLGRKFISFYYEYGPTAAEFIKTKEYIKKPLRKIFTLIAKILP